MKKLRISILGASFGLFLALNTATALDVETGLTISAIVGYADAPALALGGTELSFRLGEATRWGRWDFGLEAGLSPIGTQILFPLRAFVTIGRSGPVEFLAGGGILAGIALFKPWPLFMGGADLSISSRWNLNAALSLIGSIGVRYTDCPAYSAIYPYHVLEIPFSVSVAL